MDEIKRKIKRRIIVYGSVTRYGPQTNCQRNETQIYTTKYEYHKYLVANDLDVDATLNLHWKKKKKR